MPWCSTMTPAVMPNGSGNGSAAADGGMQKAWIPPDAVWSWKDKKDLYVKFLNVDLLADWTVGDGQHMNTDTILRYANTWSDMSGGKIPRFVEAKNGETAQIRVSFNGMLVNILYTIACRCTYVVDYELPLALVLSRACLHVNLPQKLCTSVPAMSL